VEERVLYRGAQPTSDTALGRDDFAVLISKYNIRTIVDLMNEPVDHWILRKRRDCAMLTKAEKETLRFVALPSYEPFPRRKTLIKMLRIVEKPENQPVFVHCSAGANRTGAMIAGFRVVEQSEFWDAPNAEAEMTQFHVLRIWQGINNRFIDGLARDSAAVRQEVRAASDEEPVVVACSR
jgi:Tyrosine phosphatase family